MGSWCVLEEYLKDNFYAGFHTHSYHFCRDMHLSSRLDVNFDKVIGAFEGTRSWCVLEGCVEGNYYARLSLLQRNAL